MAPAAHAGWTRLSLYIQMTVETRAGGNFEERVVPSVTCHEEESMGPGTSGVPGDLTRQGRQMAGAEARW